jgi:hypothetical protein
MSGTAAAAKPIVNTHPNTIFTTLLLSQSQSLGHTQ